MENENQPSERPVRPPLTIEARENQMIALSFDLVEKRLRNGSASSQETTHFLKLATMKEANERRIQELEMQLLEAKTEALRSEKMSEKLCQDAIDAMRKYSGNYTEEEWQQGW